MDNLDYDDEKAFQLLKRIFYRANDSFLLKDKSLIFDNVSERALCGSLSYYIKKELSLNEIKGYYAV